MAATDALLRFGAWIGLGRFPNGTQRGHREKVSLVPVYCACIDS